MNPIQTLSIGGLAPLILMLALLGFTAQRSGLRALGSWLAAWAALLASAWFILWTPSAPAVQPMSFLFSSLVAPLMLLGAYEHAEREPPGWILPVGFGLAVARLAAFQLGHPEFSRVIAAVSEPPLAIQAALVASHWWARHERPASRAEKLLGLAFLVYGAVELYDAVGRLTGAIESISWSVWIVGCLPLFAIQCVQQIHRLGRSASAERRTALAYARRLEVLTSASQDRVVEFDDRGFVTFASPSVESLDSRAGDPLVGRSVLEFFDDETSSPIVNALKQGRRISEQIVASAAPISADATLPDGSKRWYESTRATYRTPEGQLRIVVRTRDVTDRAEAAFETRERERRLNQAEQIASLGSWEYYPEEQKIYWSDQLFRMMGLPPSDGPIDPREVSEFVDPEDLGRMVTASRESPTPSGSIQRDYRIRRADDGRARTLRARGEVELDADGRVLRVIGATMDVTERLELEERLRRGQEHFKMFVDSDIVGVFYGERDGRISDANDAFLSRLGYSKADLPLDWRQLTPEDQKSQDRRVQDEFPRTGTTFPYEKQFLSATGDRVPMLIGCARTEQHQALVIAVDLSERKRAEAYIARYQKELEDTVAYRTQELMESRGRLIESERLAAVGILTAGVAHQINNPIGAILNSAEYALMCREEDSARETFENALRVHLSEAKRCAQIVRSMLKFSRDETTPKWNEVLGRVVRRAHRAVKAYATDRGATIRQNVPTQPIYALISPIEIEQALVNVLRNAIESSSRGAIVSIELSQRDKIAEIEIVDDGRGIEAEIRDHLFEPFYSTRTRDGGTGLGLSVAHGIVTDHGGEIRIDSEPDEGTRVLITLPVVEIVGGTQA